MERSWKNFKLDKNKVYAFIGKAVVYGSLYVATVYGIFYAICNCITVY